MVFPFTDPSLLVIIFYCFHHRDHVVLKKDLVGISQVGNLIQEQNLGYATCVLPCAHLACILTAWHH